LSVSFNRHSLPSFSFSPTENACPPARRGQGISLHFLPSFAYGRKAALLLVLPIPASGNTQYEVTQASLLWAMAAALDLHRDIAFPVLLHKGLSPSVLPSAKADACCGFAGLSAEQSDGYSG